MLLKWRYLFVGSVVALALVSAEAVYIKHLWGVVDGKNTALRTASHQLLVASAAIRERDGKILANADGERRDATDTSIFWKGQSRAAFDAGFAAHRCPGEPGGVRDLRTIWEAGALKPSPRAVPGKPDRAH